MQRTFRKGSSTFNCRCCGRLTRDTTGSDLGLCIHCEDIAGMENSINDGHTEEAEGRRFIAEQIADLRSKFGDAVADKAARWTEFA